MNSSQDYTESKYYEDYLEMLAQEALIEQRDIEIQQAHHETIHAGCIEFVHCKGCDNCIDCDICNYDEYDPWREHGSHEPISRR